MCPTSKTDAQQEAQTASQAEPQAEPQEKSQEKPQSESQAEPQAEPQAESHAESHSATQPAVAAPEPAVPRLEWTEAMDLAMFEALLEAKRAGAMTDDGDFEVPAWNKATGAVAAAHRRDIMLSSSKNNKNSKGKGKRKSKNSSKSDENNDNNNNNNDSNSIERQKNIKIKPLDLKNRWHHEFKDVGQLWHDHVEAVSYRRSGWKFNASKRTFLAAPDTMDDYFAENPERARFRESGPRYHRQLDDLFYVFGRYAVSLHNLLDSDDDLPSKKRKRTSTKPASSSKAASSSGGNGGDGDGDGDGGETKRQKKPP